MQFQSTTTVNALPPPGNIGGAQAPSASPTFFPLVSTVTVNTFCAFEFDAARFLLSAVYTITITLAASTLKYTHTSIT